MTSTNARRIRVILLAIVVIAVLVFGDRARSTPRSVDVVSGRSLMPAASPPDAVSSAFFCAGGTASGSGGFESTIVIANPNANSITATVTSYPAALPSDQAGQASVASLAPVSKSVTVGARSRAEVPLAQIQASPFAAALVETNDGDISVEHRTATAVGSSSSPCASAPSPTWYFPTGTTTRDAHELLAVFNPFPVDAVLDITFQTSDGFRAPTALQALPVPGGHVRIVDVNEQAPRIAQLAAFVVARSGEVVVDRLQSFDGSDPAHPAGAVAMLGAPLPATEWVFPEGAVNEGLTETVTVQNPSDQPSSVQVEVILDDPDTNGVVDPIPLTVQPASYTQVALHQETRVPKGVGHTIVVRTTSGPPVVAERVVTGAAPAPRHGYGPAIGSPLSSTSWLFADGRAMAGTDAEFIVLFNPARDVTAHVSLTALAQGQALAIDGLQQIEVRPGARVALDLGQHVNRADLPVLVNSDAPVVAERGLYAASGPGLSLAAGMPLAGHASVLGR